LAAQDGTILYHTIQWFAPLSSISTTGSTVNIGSTQFTSGMVGAKLTISGESRIITTYNSTSQVTVASAYSQNYSGVASGSWGVYSKALQIGGSLPSSQPFSFYSSDGSAGLSTNYGFLINTNVAFGQSALLSNNDIRLASGNLKWTSGGPNDVFDLGLRRNNTGSLEIYNGVTADGTLANRRDLLVRDISGSNAVFSGSVNILGSQNITGSLNVSGSITTTGTITAQTLVVQVVSSSIVYSSGSNIFGTKSIDTQQFTGSLLVSGSITVSGSVINNLTASYAVSASQAISASQALTASYVLASGVVGLNLSQIASGSVTASVDPTYGFRVNSNTSITGSLSLNQIIAPATNTPILNLTGNVSASSALAQGAYLIPTLVASANSDVLVGLDINPTFVNGAFTGVGNYAARFQDAVLITKNTNTLWTGLNLTNSNTNSSAAVYTILNSDVSSLSNSVFSSTRLNNSTNQYVNGAAALLDYQGTASLNIASANSAGTNSGIRFWTGISSNLATEKIRIFPSGNLTIQNGGTFTDNSYQLEIVGGQRNIVNSNTLYNVLTLKNSNASSGASATFALQADVSFLNQFVFSSTRTNDNSNQYNIGASALFDYQGLGSLNFASTSTTSSNNGIRFWTGASTNLATERMRLFSTGNLLLQSGGTFTDAGYKLDVNGTARVQGVTTISRNDNSLSSSLYIVNTSTTGTNNIRIGQDAANNTLGFGWFPSGATIYNSLIPNTAYMYALTGASQLSFNTTTASQPITFATNDWNEKMRIFGGGNVIIGGGNTPTDAGYKLDVNGTARVQGNTQVTGSLNVSGSITTTGTLTAQTLVVQTVSSSVIYSSGSNVFGNLASNTQQFTGSILVSGSITVSGSVINNLTSSFAISSSFATSASNAQTASYVNALRQTVIITGSLVISGSNANSSSLAIIGTGSGVFTVDGTSGRLFSVDDSLSGSLFSVNTAAGLPVIEAFSDNTVRIGQFGKKALFISQSIVGINKETALNGVLDISGSTVITGSLIVTGSSHAIFGNVGIGITGSSAYGLDVIGATRFNGNSQITGSLIVNGTSAVIGFSANYGNTLFSNGSWGYTRVGGSSEPTIAMISNIQTSTQTLDGVTIPRTGSALVFSSGYGYDTGFEHQIISVGRLGVRVNNTTSALTIPTSGIVTANQGLIVSGSLTVITGSGIEFQVTNTGTKIGNNITDTHTVTGSLNVSGSITTTGTITAQTLVVQVVSSSIVYSSGSNIFGNNITNTQTFTGSVGMTGSLNVVGNTTITGSLTVTGSVFITSASIDNQQILSTASGSYQIVTSTVTGSYKAAFFDYVIFSGSATRAGTVVSTWSNNAVDYYENYTNDVSGSTSKVTLRVALTGSNVQLQATSSNAAWTIRSLIRLI
jgi:hypothetical protein